LSLSRAAGGGRGPDFIGDLDGLEVSRSNQLVVLPTLQATLDPDIFAIGDRASCLNPASGQPVPLEGYFALLVYRSLYKMHQVALHGGVKVVLDTIGRLISRRNVPQIKLH
jgi:NADH dehydrogenase FAD-containing subunit